MIIDTVVNSLQTTSKVKGSKMTINVTGSSFGFILENLYTNPHKAIVRELVCNAIDAHQAVGNTNPYHLQVPSKFDPTFILRDFGPGLNAEEIDKYLNTLYESSKGETNDQIGGFGLGSKSPFSLVPSFFLTSYKDGIEYKCFWYRDSEGIPVLKIQNTSETSEPNGLKYTISFAEKDVDLISKACETELYNFSLLPKFYSELGNESTAYDIWEPYSLVKSQDNSEYTIYSAKNLSLFNGHSYGYYKNLIVSIGGVVYTITDRDCTSLFHSKLAGFIGNSSVLIIKIPIGKLKLPSTREHVLETTENAEVLKQYILSTFETISKDLKENYQVLFDEDFTKAPLKVNMFNYFKYCTDNGYSTQYLYTLLYNNVAIPDLDILGFLNTESFDGYKLLPSKIQYNHTGFNAFSLGVPLSKDPKSNTVQRSENIFLVQDISTSTHKVTPRNYGFNPLHNSYSKNTLYIYADTRVPASWLYGIKDLDTYKAIQVLRPNHVLFEGVKERIEDGFNLLSVIAAANEWTLIRASGITKPENHAVKTGSTTTTQGFSHYKIASIAEYSSPKKIFKQQDSNGKAIPFGLHYIEEREEVFYRLKNSNKWIPLHVRCYLNHFKNDTIYVIDESKEQDFLDLFKDHPKIKKVHRIETNLELDLRPLFDPKVRTLISFTKLFNSCQSNLTLFELLAKNILKEHPTLSDEEFSRVMSNLRHDVSHGRYNRHVMFNIVSNYELRSLITQLQTLDPYIDDDLINTAYTSLDKDTIDDFIKTCIPPALTNYINISLKDR